MKNYLSTIALELIDKEILKNIRLLDQLPFLQMVLIVIALTLLTMGIFYLLVKTFCKADINMEGVCIANELNAAVYGLIIALILVALFDKAQKTDNSVSSEANNLLFVLRNSEGFNNSLEIQAAVKNYTNIVINKQWSLMYRGELDKARTLTEQAINPIYKAIQRFQPNGIVQTSFYATLPGILNNLNKNQVTRLNMAGILIPIQFWRVINLMTILLLLLLVYGNFRGGSFFPAISTGIVVALAYSLLISFHYPFLGPSAVSNDALVQIQDYINNIGELSSQSPLQPIMNMSILDSFSDKILKTIFWLSGTSFFNLIFILFGIGFSILGIFIFLMNYFRKSEEISDGASMANTTSVSIYGLILALFVVAFFDGNQQAKESIDKEVGCLTAISKNVQILDNSSQIQEAIKDYIKVVVEDQWPRLCAGKVDEVLHSSITSLNPLYQTIREAKPQGVAQDKFYATLPKLLNHLEVAQRERIMSADLHLPIQFWRVIFLMTLLTFALLAYTNPWKGIGTLIPILIPSLVIVFSIGLLITFHYPFIGPFKVSPDNYLKVDFS
ncbi:MAG: DUF4239 domain-containing protein [Chthoniobacterales bacterium]|nr:DUF4239 domain-containing protein [Chthoniobacterales bacterium]